MRAIEDRRQIESIQLENWGESIGTDGVTDIIAYEEYGEMSTITWFEVFTNNHPEPTRRVNGRFVQIVNYKEGSVQPKEKF